MKPPRPLPELPASPDSALLALRREAVASLVDFVDERLAAPVPAPSALEDYSLRHLAKAVGTTRSALTLMAGDRWIDACILTRAIFEQLFAYLWVVQDPERAHARAVMVTIKQEWANAKYLEALAAIADAASQPVLREEAASYRRIAETLLEELAAELGSSVKKVRDEATLRVSAKAIEVNLGPRFSVPYAYYSGFVHTDGNALTTYGTAVAGGVAYESRGGVPRGVPLASDMHRVILRMIQEVRTRTSVLAGPVVQGYLDAHAAWLDAADAREGHPTSSGSSA